MLKRAPLAWSGKFWFVDLPQFTIVDGTFLPVTPGLIGKDGPELKAVPADVLALKPSVVVDLPDAWFDKAGALQPALLRELYPSRCGAGYVPPQLTAP